MSSSTDKKDPFDVLLDAYLKELMEMTDADVLDGDDPAKVKAAGTQMLDAAKAEAGRRRLAAAKAQLVSRKAAFKEEMPTVPVAVARDFLRKASNDPRFTLAARGLDEMSDDDALLRLYHQFKRLERAEDEPTEGDT